MRRREFIVLSGSAAAAWPFAALAQPPTARTVGYLSARSASTETEFLAWFRQGLGETGWIAGQNLRIEYRWADGQYDRLDGLAADLLRSGADVIATTGGSQPARAAQRLTQTIPIVFTSGTDPVRDGLVKSFNRPGGNVTGIHVFTTSLGPKRLEMLRELMTKARVIAFLVNPSSQIAEMQVKELEDTARAMGLELLALNASTANELELAFTALVQSEAGALLMSADLFFQVQRDQLVALAARHRVAAMYEWPEFVRAGGLISYSTSRRDAFRQFGVYVGRVLNGANPAELPVVQSTRFELAVNLKTAKVLGLIIPPTLLASADEVID